MKYLTYIGPTSHSERSSDHLLQKITGFTIISLFLENPDRASKPDRRISFGHVEVPPWYLATKEFSLAHL